jgi:hypothetical protein
MCNVGNVLMCPHIFHYGFFFLQKRRIILMTLSLALFRSLASEVPRWRTSSWSPLRMCKCAPPVLCMCHMIMSPVHVPRDHVPCDSFLWHVAGLPLCRNQGRFRNTGSMIWQNKELGVKLRGRATSGIKNEEKLTVGVKMEFQDWSPEPAGKG